MSNSSKTSKQYERFEQVISGVLRGDVEAALVYNILTYVYMLNHPKNPDDPGIEMAASDLADNFAQFAALKKPGRDLHKDPLLLDLVKVTDREKMWDLPPDVERMQQVYGDLADVFAQADAGVIARCDFGSRRLLGRRNEGAVRSYMPEAAR